MRIERIELLNFRNYQHAIFDLTEPRTLIVGPNGSGKSTLIDAVAWALSGRCRGVDGKGTGQKDLIRTGAESATVRLHTDTVGVVERSVSRAGGASSNVKVDAILARLGVSDTMLQAALYGRTFFTLHHADAKAMLMQLLNVTVPAADLPGVDLPKGKDAVDLDTLEFEYNRAYQERASLKKAQAAVPVPDVVRRADLERLDLTALTADADVAHQAVLAATREAETATQDQRRLTKALADADQAQVNVTAVTSARDVHVSLRANTQAALEAARFELATAEDLPAEPVAELQSAISHNRDLITKLKVHQPERGCVLAAGIPCHTDAGLFTGQVKALDKVVKDLDKRVKAGNDRATKIAAAQRAVKDAERNLAYHEQQVLDADVALAAADTLKADRDRIAADLDALVGRVEAAQAALQAALTTWQTLQAQVQAVHVYRAGLDAHKALQAKRADLDAQVQRAEDLVTLLGPKGIRATVLQQALGEFEAAINQALAPFGFTLSFTVDPWDVLVHQRDAAAPVRFDMLSAGEQLWTGLAFQASLACMSGLQFCALDATEAVVGQNRRLLSELVMDLPVDQVLIGMAKGEQDPLPDIEGLQVLQVALAQQVAA